MEHCSRWQHRSIPFRFSFVVSCPASPLYNPCNTLPFCRDIAESELKLEADPDDRAEEDGEHGEEKSEAGFVPQQQLSMKSSFMVIANAASETQETLLDAIAVSLRVAMGVHSLFYVSPDITSASMAK